MSEEKHVVFKRINALLIFITAFTLITLMYFPKYKKMHKMKNDEDVLDKKITEKNKLLKDLKEKQKALVKDKEYLEKIARDKMGYSGSKEIIYQFEDEDQQK